MAELPKKFLIGKRNAKGRLERAFYIHKRDNPDGGIRLTDVKPGKLNEIERNRIFMHFGSEKTDRTGGERDGRDIQIMTTEQPGTDAHFVRAATSIPEPFSVMAEST